MGGLEDVIRKNLELAAERIERAALSAGRRPGGVRVVVVTKAQPVEVVQSAIRAGARLIGENYPEEAVEKIARIEGSAEAEWHMIGHLQSRKARLVIEHFQMLESLDRVDLAEKLERQLAGLGRTLPVLLEYNVGGEESKFGWNAQDESNWENLLPDFERILSLPHIQVKGLMTMPPYFEQAELSRPAFVRLARLRDFLARRCPAADLAELSMGTSVDYPVAVQEGATLVRLGTAIVGPRPAKPL